MEENGTFVALITINLGGVGLLATYFMASYFFYTERISDLTTSIITGTGTLKLKISNYIVLDVEKRGDYGEEYIKNLKLEYALFFKEIMVENLSKSESLNKNLDLIKKLTLNTFYLRFIDKKFFELLNVLEKKERIKKTEILNFREELENSISSFNSVQYCTNLYSQNFKSKYSYQKKIKSEQFESIKKEFDQEISFLENLNEKIKTDIIKDMQDSVLKLNKLIFLIGRQNSQNNNVALYYGILMSVIFGILIPLTCITTLPNNDYFFLDQFDRSNIVAAFLAFCSLCPYAIILGMLHKVIKTK